MYSMPKSDIDNIKTQIRRKQEYVKEDKDSSKKYIIFEIFAVA